MQAGIAAAACNNYPVSYIRPAQLDLASYKLSNIATVQAGIAAAAFDYLVIYIRPAQLDLAFCKLSNIATVQAGISAAAFDYPVIYIRPAQLDIASCQLSNNCDSAGRQEGSAEAAAAFDKLDLMQSTTRSSIL